MKARYWAASAAVPAGPADPDAGASLLATLSAALPDADRLLIDVIEETDDSGDKDLAVLIGRTLLSSADQAYGIVAFTDSIALCNLLSGLGFLALTTRIAFDGDCLTVHDPLATSDDAALLTIDGIEFHDRDGAGIDFRFEYRQFLFTPALGRSDVDVFVQPATCPTQRRFSTGAGEKGMEPRPPRPATVKASRSSRISLAPLTDSAWPLERMRSGPMQPLPRPQPPDAVSAAQVSEPVPAKKRKASKAPPAPPAPTPPAAPAAPVVPPAAPFLLRRPDTFLATGYRFDNVELFGFRIDLDAYGDGVDGLLKDLVAPLNFHLANAMPVRVGGRNERQDFVYRPASRTIVVELLRYGRMYWGAKAGTAYPEPFTSQHELLVRLLVGRVDDDASQGRDPALYVPAIFVDNAWSQLIGRTFQGFDKRLAAFSSRECRVRMDGTEDRPGPSRVMPLADVTRIGSLARAGATQTEDLLSITYPGSLDKSPRWLNGATDTDAVIGSALLRSRWRQSDFRDEEFRRSFAREVLDDGMARFGSIQIAPFEPGGLPSAWITGRLTLKRARAVYPPGVVRLQFSAPPSAPSAWSRIAELFDDAEVALASGNWYRAACSIEMQIDDGLI